MNDPRRMRTGLALAALMTVPFATGACGSDEKEATAITTTTQAPSSSSSSPEAGSDEYCALVAEINAAEAIPTTDQIARYGELAPESIIDDVNVVGPAFEEARAADDPEAVLAAPEIEAALGRIVAIEESTCPAE